ncbi:MAG TPA: SDR family oxidoreductase [Noviherbaspirillum sp.]|uniref:SDR family oxidoreductase n=1 Tax=Noviherbaspirillum sp. TaxID=1926288 RepID=UPI002D3CDE33|nr:SDR family oxidoreductase [Noviherbaspirillum sp.]HYD95877.1 SDR family oxidoreductase [Noviherbaspirillum sp.]
MKKTALITGCSSGIGRALAEELHRRGYLVYATARRVDALAELAARGMRAVPLDVTDMDSVAALAERLRRDDVKLDMLVNNAGYGTMGALLDVPLPELRRQFETNVFSVISLVQALLPNLLATGNALIVNISSISGVTATPFAGAYCASKAALNLLSDALRMELVPFGIRVITVQPGGIASQFGHAAEKHAAEPSPGSLYRPLRRQIHERAMMSQINAMPAEEFARRLADRLITADPPPVIRIGPKSTLLPMLKRWLPTHMLDRFLSRKFGLDVDVLRRQ